jgi:hypothetical protein
VTFWILLWSDLDFRDGIAAPYTNVVIEAITHAEKDQERERRFGDASRLWSLPCKSLLGRGFTLLHDVLVVFTGSAIGTWCLGFSDLRAGAHSVRQEALARRNFSWLATLVRRLL